MKQKGWHKWTKEEDQFLIDNYGWIGDVRLAEMFEERFPKGYPWTCKHIEKRRYYLKLKRTSEQEQTLAYLNRITTCRFKSWDTRGRHKEGTIVEWYVRDRKRKYIKFRGKFRLYSRHKYKEDHGVEPLPNHVVRKDGRQYSRAENAIINSTQRNGKLYPAELLDTIISIHKLNRKIKEHEKQD